MTAGDFNGDGKLDLAVANYGSNTVSILLGNGDGTFQSHLDYRTGGGPSAVAAADLNDDGGLDLVVANAASNTASVLLSAPVAAFSPARLTFAGQEVGATSAAEPVLVSNPGTGRLRFSSILASGDFAETDTCASAVAPGTNCSLSVTLTPTGAVPRAGALILNDNALSGPQAIPLAGSGLAASANLSPATLAFGNVAVGTTSPPQVITLSNVGNTALAINSIVTTWQFAQGSNCAKFINPGASCVLQVTFTPAAAGLQTGFVTINDAGQGEQGVALSGTGTGGGNPQTPIVLPGSLVGPHNAVATTSPTGPAPIVTSIPPATSASIRTDESPAAPSREEVATPAVDLPEEKPARAEAVVTLSTEAVPFGRQRLHARSEPQTITLTNTGNAPLEIRGISTSGADFAQTNNCGFSLPAGAGCTIQVTFTPSKQGRIEGSLRIDAGSESPHQVRLFGPGAAEPAASTEGRTSDTRSHFKTLYNGMNLR